MSTKKFASLNADLLDRSGAEAALAAELAFQAFGGSVNATWREDAAPLEPRALTKTQAAKYVGVSPKTFFKLVDQGVFDQPMRLAEQTRWDRLALDRALDRMSGLAVAN
jgi:predicted DNA-binding transcriptional regulator AlpA